MFRKDIGHHLSIKMIKNMRKGYQKIAQHDIIKALEYVFSVLGAVYERNGLVENQIVRVDIEGEYGRLSPGFISTLLNHINKRSMAYMNAVKKTERHYFLFCHQLTS